MSTGAAAAEFDIIARYFGALGADRGDAPLRVGDDAALLAPPPGMAIAVAAVSLDADGDGAGAAQSLARHAVRSAAAALRDARAQPAWATLALTLERVDGSWLQEFSGALDGALREEGVALVGGDTTRGPGTVTLALIGVREGGAARPVSAR